MSAASSETGEHTASRPSKRQRHNGAVNSSPASTGSLEEGQLDSDQDVGEASFMFDTVGDMTVDKEASTLAAQESETHTEGGLLLPNHVALIKPAEAAIIEAADDAEQDALGEYEQLDQDPSTANRYYGAEEKAERRAKEQCTACGELGHDRRHCPHQHCLACGAMDEHPTRACPMSTSCFRCGGMGHQSRSCPQPRRPGGGRNQECTRCGSWNHAKALCPTLWRLYAYNNVLDYDRHRAKAFFRRQRPKVNPMHNLEPDPEEVSDSEDEFRRHDEPGLPLLKKGTSFDPAARWCYNCCSNDNHWGDDCPEARTNPTRTNGEPSAFSEFVSRWGPFAVEIPSAPTKEALPSSSSQFTFNVGTDAMMHVVGSPSSASRSREPKASLLARIVDATKTASGKNSGNKAPPNPRSDDDDTGGHAFRQFGRTKAIYKDGGYLLPRELQKGLSPLPEHIFRQWLDERHNEGVDRDNFVIRALTETERNQSGGSEGSVKKSKAERKTEIDKKRRDAKDRKKKKHTAEATQKKKKKDKKRKAVDDPPKEGEASNSSRKPQKSPKKGPKAKGASSPARGENSSSSPNRGHGRGKGRGGFNTSPRHTKRESSPATNSSKYRGGYFN